MPTNTARYTRAAAGVHGAGVLFVARFENGYETCHQVFCWPENLDLHNGRRLADRGRRRLAVTALQLLKKKREAGEPVDDEAVTLVYAALQTQPQVVAARFENLDGVVLQSYDADAITATLSRFARTGT
jgi:hypothetical protein